MGELKFCQELFFLRRTDCHKQQISISFLNILYNAPAIFFGDPIQWNSPADGTIIQAPSSSGGPFQIAGVFIGCKYLSVSQKRTVLSNYWPGSDATGDVEAYVIDDPNTRFVVQTSGSSFQITGTPTTFTSAPIGKYAQLNVGSGSSSTGISGMYLDTIATTSTFPFIIVDLVLNPPGANGTDATSNYNYVVVGFNNEWLRTNSAVTGI